MRLQQVCLRCSEEKIVDNFNLCDKCSIEIEQEYLNLYTPKTMEY